MRDLRLSKSTQQRRRFVKIQRHGPKGARSIYWCGYCEVYTYNLSTHICGKRQSS
jgi:hypothetical protein